MVDKEAFLNSIWLHDIGKIGIPHRVMDKNTRLGNQYEAVRYRFHIALLMEKIWYLEGECTKDEMERYTEELKEAIALIEETNAVGSLTDEQIEKLLKISLLKGYDEQKRRIDLITEEEKKDMLIHRGTLNEDERRTMESHVVYTRELLMKMKFNGKNKNIMEWASSHHEYLDGSGYSEHKKEEELPMEVRLLTVIDIYDALTAENRPYKRPMNAEKAFEILRSMCREGKLDGRVVEEFYRSGAWQKNREHKA